MTGRDAIVAAARGWIGTPYHHGASLRGVGCDCLGLLRGVWREVVGPEPEAPPPYRADWAEAGGREAFLEAAARHLAPVPIADARAGDVLLFRWRTGTPAKHAAILTGPLAAPVRPAGRSPAAMVHAHEGAAVCEVALVPQWSRRIAAAFAFPEKRP